MIALGRVSWFKLDKKFGFVELEGGLGDAFLHVSALKAAGYVSVPAGTTMQVEIERQQRRQRAFGLSRSTQAPHSPVSSLQYIESQKIQTETLPRG